jgi:hypothetical protein
MSKHSQQPIQVQEMLPQSEILDPAASAELALQNLDRADIREQHGRIATAALYAGSLVGGAALWVSGKSSSLRFEQAMPYLEPAQRAVNDVQGALEVTGAVSLALSAGVILGAKVGASLNPHIHSIDRWSSREMSEDRLQPRRSPFKRALEATFAGRVPVMASIGAGLAVFASSISGEVSNGPERPIEKAMSTLVPGESMVTNYAGAMPMVESSVSRGLADRILSIATAEKIRAGILDENLGQMVKSGQTLSDLSLGVSTPENSPTSFAVGSSCNSIPIMIDRTAGVDVGQMVELNGINARVVGEIDGISATNRVGIVMDQEAMATCLKKDPESSVHSIVLDTSPEKTQQILDAANQDNEVSTVITKQHYLANSKEFWDSNVKPITSVLALFAGLFASAVSGSRMHESLVRHRREWAAKLGRGIGEGTIRATESLRVLKDGVLASVIGGSAAMFATPVVVNSLESGFQASVGLKELMVGSSVAIGGSLLGALKSLIHPKKIIRTEESLRS